MPTPASLFDAYLMVDWSANSKPKTGKDSIWLGLATRVGPRITHEQPENPPTRAFAEARVRQLVIDAVEQGQRVLVGLDFAYGYATGFAAALGLRGPPWLAVWELLSELITDDSSNHNNRWKVAAGINAKLMGGTTIGPFWGCPAGRVCPELAADKKNLSFPMTTKSAVVLEEYRVTDRQRRNAGHQAQSPWKLFTSGSVGSQALMGIPVVHRLRGSPSRTSSGR